MYRLVIVLWKTIHNHPQDSFETNLLFVLDNTFLRSFNLHSISNNSFKLTTMSSEYDSLFPEVLIFSLLSSVLCILPSVINVFEHIALQIPNIELMNSYILFVILVDPDDGDFHSARDATFTHSLLHSGGTTAV